MTEITAAVIGDNCGSYLVKLGCFSGKNGAKTGFLKGRFMSL